MWEQGEHVAIIGDTGSGKTYLENKLLKLRSWVVFLRTKAEDPASDPMDRTWRRVSATRDITTQRHYWLLDPPQAQQRIEGLRLFGKVRRERNWTVAIDELYGASLKPPDGPGLQTPITWALTQGRSSHLTVVCGMQRPVGVTRFALSQCSHAFIFALEGRDLLETISQAFTPRFRQAIPALNWERHEFAYYNRRTRRMLIADASQIEQFM